MNATMKIAIFDHSTGKYFPKADVATALEDFVVDMLDAFNNEFAAEHGGVYEVRLATSPTDRHPDEYGAHVRDETPEAPDAVAFHQVVNGVPDIELALNTCNSLKSGSDSMTCAFSHENFETAKDLGANGWKLQGDNKLHVEEESDKVQNIFYVKARGSTISDWLLKSAFIPGAPKPWNYVSKSTGQDLMDSQEDFKNGYDVTADISNVQQFMARAATETHHIERHTDSGGRTVHVMHDEHGDHIATITTHGTQNLSEHAKKRKASPYSRTYRRGARV